MADTGITQGASPNGDQWAWMRANCDVCAHSDGCDNDCQHGAESVGDFGYGPCPDLLYANGTDAWAAAVRAGNGRQEVGTANSASDRDCSTCVNDPICKGYRDEPAIVCHDYEDSQGRH